MSDENTALTRLTLTLKRLGMKETSPLLWGKAKNIKQLPLLPQASEVCRCSSNQRITWFSASLCLSASVVFTLKKVVFVLFCLMFMMCKEEKRWQ